MGGPEQLSFKPDELPIFSERIDPAPFFYGVEYYSNIKCRKKSFIPLTAGKVLPAVLSGRLSLFVIKKEFLP